MTLQVVNVLFCRDSVVNVHNALTHRTEHLVWADKTKPYHERSVHVVSDDYYDWLRGPGAERSDAPPGGVVATYGPDSERARIMRDQQIPPFDPPAPSQDPSGSGELL